ncbi:hypothetical protein FSP39_018174, partial [Pinctada imbricata]
HGRIKVKTTAEQQEAKRKEREKKLKIYNAGTAASFKKKGEKEYDEEGLKISGEILSVNPDFYTLWNYRKEAYLHLKDNRSPEELQSLMANELYFLENCLKVNPKSYGTWHHRCFIMENMPEPDWGRELQLCNTFLEMDERNFHCWDYRRYVVLMSEVDLEEELDYTTQKIQSNFSNYSSWHYRSKLLPMIHPDPTNPTRVQEDILLQEHETVQNAVFTDPDDQSAWFYHRWLLGRGRKKLQISCVHINRNHKRIIVLLTNPIRVPYGHSLQLHIDGTSVDVTWKNVLGDPYHNSIWMCHFEKDIPSDVEVSIAVTLETHSDATQFSQGLHLPANQNEAWVMAEYKVGSRFSAELSAAATSTLEKELEAIKELHSVEPENKWVLLTLLFLMKAMDPRHDNCSAEITDCFFKLVHVDEKRKYYYRDLSIFDPDPELSEILTKLWELDSNKCYDGVEFEIDLQGYVKSGRHLERDRARYNLFAWVDEEKVFERKTYKTFRALLDNYELECGKPERVTDEERKENRDFIDAIMETELMQEAHSYLIKHGKAPEGLIDFKRLLYKTWFTLMRRTKGDRDFDSSSFEHVFVGEGREDQFIGLHNWIQFYLQEKAGNIDYHGYFRRETVQDDEHFRLIALQFDWRNEKGKPMSSCFLGTSPEFEIAAYTICYLMGKTGCIDCQIGEYEVEVSCKCIGRLGIGTAYIAAARM